MPFEGDALLAGSLRNYRYADVTLRSSWSLPELLEIEPASPFSSEITVELAGLRLQEPEASAWSHCFSARENGTLTHSFATTESGYLLRFPDLAAFHVAYDGCLIGAWPRGDTSMETLRHLLLDQVLPRVLAHRGSLVLHGGAARMGEQAIVFLGETGQGKSTLTASLNAAGYPLLGDDAIMVTRKRGVACALPPYPSLRLWPDSVAGLYSRPPALASLAHYSSKQRVMAPDTPTAARVPLPMAAVYVLAREAEAEHGGISLKRMSAREACVAILGNSFQFDPTDSEQGSRRLVSASAVAQDVPVFSLAFPRCFTRLKDVHEAIFSQRHEWRHGAVEGALLSESSIEYDSRV